MIQPPYDAEDMAFNREWGIEVGTTWSMVLGGVIMAAVTVAFWAAVLVWAL